MEKRKPLNSLENRGQISPVITSHYYKAGVRDFLFSQIAVHVCVEVEYE